MLMVYEPMYAEAAKSALEVQDACNIGGVSRTFAGAVAAVFGEAHLQGKGNDWVASHPIVTMFLLKMAELNGKIQCTTMDPAYKAALEACQDIIQEAESHAR